MSEDFLHYIWSFQKFNFRGLKTIKGQPITILNPGTHNRDAGPDFKNAKLLIGEIEWFGNVEIHIKSSIWNQHCHHKDSKYNSVVLHVVYEHDKDVSDKSGYYLQTCELKGLIKSELINSYEHLQMQESPILCASQIDKVDRVISFSMIEMSTFSRLEEKRKIIVDLIKKNNSDWEMTFFQSLARNFGFNKNGEAFFDLSKLVSYELISKVSNNLLRLEALMLGVAGLLSSKNNHSYLEKLKSEFKFLSAKHQLIKADMSQQWKFHRTRPQNFPTLRIAQLCALLHITPRLLRATIEATDLATLKKLFVCKPSEFWRTHFSFNSPSKQHSAKLGSASIENILINTVIPFLFAYGKFHGDQDLIDKGVLFLEQLDPESNFIIGNWASLKIKPYNAFESQGLIHLYNKYCLQRKCMSCKIGIHLIKV